MVRSTRPGISRFRVAPTRNDEAASLAMTVAEITPMRFDLVDLQLFVSVADARSITAGAERAHLALASASERIRGLEDALGVALFTRGRRGVALTAAGES